MLLTDVNILVYAVDEEYPENARYNDWLEGTLDQPGLLGVSDLVLSGFIRIVTHPRILKRPISCDEAIDFARQLREHPHSEPVNPGPRHWDIFITYCEQTKAVSNTVPDAYHAALAVEHDCEWVTEDGGFQRFPGLRWRRPFEE